jgi:hypothetical protein
MGPAMEPAAGHAASKLKGRVMSARWRRLDIAPKELVRSIAPPAHSGNRSTAGEPRQQ